MARPKRDKLCYQIYKFDKDEKIFKKHSKHKTITEIAENIDVTNPTVYQILKGTSKKYCKIYKIERL